MTTVAEVAHVTSLLAGVIGDPARADTLRARVAEVARGRADDETYPDTAAFWCADSRRAIDAVPEVAS